MQVRQPQWHNATFSPPSSSFTPPFCGLRPLTLILRKNSAAVAPLRQPGQWPFRGVTRQGPTAKIASNHRVASFEVAAETLDAPAGFLHVLGLGGIGDAEGRVEAERRALHHRHPL